MLVEGRGLVRTGRELIVGLSRRSSRTSGSRLTTPLSTTASAAPLKASPSEALGTQATSLHELSHFFEKSVGAGGLWIRRLEGR